MFCVAGARSVGGGSAGYSGAAAAEADMGCYSVCFEGEPFCKAFCLYDQVILRQFRHPSVGLMWVRVAAPIPRTGFEWISLS